MKGAQQDNEIGGRSHDVIIIKTFGTLMILVKISTTSRLVGNKRLRELFKSWLNLHKNNPTPGHPHSQMNNYNKL